MYPDALPLGDATSRPQENSPPGDKRMIIDPKFWRRLAQKFGRLAVKDPEFAASWHSHAASPRIGRWVIDTNGYIGKQFEELASLAGQALGATPESASATWLREIRPARRLRLAWNYLAHNPDGTEVHWQVRDLENVCQLSADHCELLATRAFTSKQRARMKRVASDETPISPPASIGSNQAPSSNKASADGTDVAGKAPEVVNDSEGPVPEMQRLRKSGRKAGRPKKEMTSEICAEWEKMGRPTDDPRVLDNLAKRFYQTEFEKAKTGSSERRGLRERIRSVLSRHRKLQHK